MIEITLIFKKDITAEELSKRFADITRQFSLAVLESEEAGNEYPDSVENIRFLNEFIFNIDWAIFEDEDVEDDEIKRIKKS